MTATEGRWTNLVGVGGSSSTMPGDSTTAGSGLFLIHAVLLRTGHVLLFSGHVEFAHYVTASWVWDPTRPVATAVRHDFPAGIGGAVVDIFCCYHLNLEDGRVLTAGGARSHPNHGTGVQDICIFDPSAPPSGWRRIGQMSEARWYPTIVNMSDGRLLIFSGRAATGSISRTVELCTPPFVGPAFTTTTVTGGTRELPTYPSMHLAPSGRVVFSGTTWRYEGGAIASSPQNTFSFGLSSATAGSWRDEGVRPAVALREEGTAVLLPPADRGRILVLGGAQAVGQADTFTGLAAGSRASSAEIFDTTTNTWSRAGPAVTVPGGTTGTMIFPRINVSAVLLPDSTVLVVGGHNSHKWAPDTAPPHAAFTTPAFAGRNTFQRTAEIYHPDTNTFTRAATMVDPRMYHSACLLLPDGRVLAAGGANGSVAETTLGIPASPGVPPSPPATIPLNQKTGEFYRPPYFFKGTRPVLRAARRDRGGPANEIRYGGQVIIETPDVASITKVALMRPGAMTHHTDSEQRYVEVSTFVKDAAAGVIRATVPSDRNVLPPGFYMLWIIKGTGTKVVPCQRAVFLRVSPRAMSISGSRCAFTRDEVDIRITSDGVARFPGAFTVVMEAFRPDELAITTATPTPVQLTAFAPTVTFTRTDGTVIPDVSAVVESMTAQDTALPRGVRQNFTFVYTTEFATNRAFDGVPSGTTMVMRITASKAGFSAELACSISLALVERLLVPLRRLAGNRFVSPQAVQLVEACAEQTATETTAFLRAVPNGEARAEMAAQSDEVDVRA
jgi:hypothetical protein